MGGDRLRPSIFEQVPEESRGNVPLLLDVLYGEMLRRVAVLDTQVKGRLGQHEGDLGRMEKRLTKVENCPCAVHRDPAHNCVILDLQKELPDVRAKITKELTKFRDEIRAEVGTMRRRLAWWGGGLAVLIFLLDLAFRLLPLVLKYHYGG